MAERLSAGERMLRNITEADWQAHVIRMARLHGWLYYHPPANRPGRNGFVQSVVAGWPDLVLIRDGDILFAELKTRLGKTTEAQEVWLAELRKCGHDAYVWRPGDDDAIAARLRRLK